MRDDDPSDLVHDLYAETYYGDTPLGRPILGTIDSATDVLPLPALPAKPMIIGWPCIKFFIDQLYHVLSTDLQII